MENFENTFQEENALSVNNEITSYLRETTKWAKFLAIFGFVMIGLLMVGGLVALGFSSAIEDIGGMPQMGAMVFVYLIIAVLYFFPLIYLYRFSTRIKEAIMAHNEAALTSGFENLKSLFKFMGIMTIVMISLYVVIFLVAIVAGMSMMG